MNRPPYGATTQRVNSLMPSASIMWSIDTLDWQHRSTNESIAIVQHNLSPGAIVLFHDVHAPSAAAVEPLLKYFKTNGYTAVTVSEILASSERTPGAAFSSGDAPQSAKSNSSTRQRSAAATN